MRILGIDPGRTNIGVAVVKEDGSCVFSAHLETRNKEVPLLMKKRAAFRRQHRTQDRRRKRQRRAIAAGTTVESNTIERLLPGYECATISAIRRRGSITAAALRVG